jgi:hypothetical protein
MTLLALLATLALAPLPHASRGDAARHAETYVDAVREINDAHAAKPAAKTEEELAKTLPEAASKALAMLLESEDEKGLADALVEAGEAALDLDRIDDFERVHARLVAVAPDAAKKLGIALSRPRFLARGTDGVELEGLTALADAFDAVLDGYADVFGITGFSKVPGKKLRLRAHLVGEIKRPPHFAPQFRWHSEVDFPVLDPKDFASPTAKGQFQFYGLCHELGHVIAMWGDRSTEEDHHSWAHYTGVVLVEELSKAKKVDVAKLRDVKWRSLSKERARLVEEQVAPGLQDRDRVLALLVELHDLVGPKAIGEAMNALDAEGKHTRVNRVRYYRMADFERALAATPAGKPKAKAIRAAFAGK